MGPRRHSWFLLSFVAILGIDQRMESFSVSPSLRNSVFQVRKKIKRIVYTRARKALELKVLAMSSGPAIWRSSYSTRWDAYMPPSSALVQVPALSQVPCHS